MHSMVMYLHIFPLQHEFNNICYGFFNISRKILEKKEKKTNFGSHSVQLQTVFILTLYTPF